MRCWHVACFTVGFSLLSALLGCGARSGLPDERRKEGAGGGGAGGAGGCEDGAVEACGSDVGACVPGKRTCKDGVFGPCEGGIGPTAEKCDGEDNNCNGIIDADCEVGRCATTLLVVGSTPSLPTCIDFPVQAGSTGMIDFPCGSGTISATLGSITFTGSVEAGALSLDGSATVLGPDGCTWNTVHHIGGMFASGTLSYAYEEHVISGHSCWQPCTETGTVTIKWE